MQDKLNATKADQPTSWEHIKGAGGVFFAALCDNYPAQLPVYRSGMESIIESLLFYFE
jgi:hypothetical protein